MHDEQKASHSPLTMYINKTTSATVRHFSNTNEIMNHFFHCNEADFTSKVSKSGCCTTIPCDALLLRLSDSNSCKDGYRVVINVDPK